MIRTLVANLEPDDGNGVERDVVLAECRRRGVEDCESQVDELVRRGELYEPRPGRLATVWAKTIWSPSR